MSTLLAAFDAYDAAQAEVTRTASDYAALCAYHGPTHPWHDQLRDAYLDARRARETVEREIVAHTAPLTPEDAASIERVRERTLNTIKEQT